MTDHRFIHFSAKPLSKVRTTSQAGDVPAMGWKPSGLWFSVGDGDDGWRSWCEAASFKMDSLRHATEMLFAETATILTLSSAPMIDSFHEEFQCVPTWARRLPSSKYHTMINWQAVAARYDAIVIAPYCYARRLHDKTFWYYPWDCACGCVWNAAAVAALHPVRIAAMQAAS